MGLLDSVIGRCFRDEQGGRVVVFTWDRRGRGYRVESATEEAKIRSFLKMHFFAYLSITLLGYLLASAWSIELVDALGRPAHHVIRTVCIFVGIYSLVVFVPTFMLWRSYKKARLSFALPENEVVVKRNPPSQQRMIASLALVAIGVLVMVGIILMVRAK